MPPSPTLAIFVCSAICLLSVWLAGRRRELGWEIVKSMTLVSFLAILFSPNVASRLAVDDSYLLAPVALTTIVIAEIGSLGRSLRAARQLAMAERSASALRRDSEQEAAAHALLFRQAAQLLAQNEQLAHAREKAEQATRIKSEFLANISHEIRTPMTTIVGFADLLHATLSGGPSDIDPQTVLASIRRNGEHLLAIINDLLDLSKIEAGRLEVEIHEFQIGQVVSDVLSLLRVRAEAKGVSLSVEYASPIPETIRSDPTRLRQILINLVSNALKFTHQGSVRLIIRFEDAPPSAPRLQFQVVDTGIGMTDSELARLFEPFCQGDASTTRRFGGTGLGLAISQRLARLLDGEISVTSVPGKGSSFVLSIATGPLDRVHWLAAPQESCHARLPDQAALNLPSLAGCRLLVAEDGLDNQRLISVILKRAGAHVTLAENGQLALDQFLLAQQQGEPFDLILSDMQMPVLDGYGLAREFRRRGVQTPIVALTAHAMASDRERCLEAGCTDFATKPIDRPKLLDVLKHWYDRSRAASAITAAASTAAISATAISAAAASDTEAAPAAASQATSAAT